MTPANLPTIAPGTLEQYPAYLDQTAALLGELLTLRLGQRVTITRGGHSGEHGTVTAIQPGPNGQAVYVVRTTALRDLPLPAAALAHYDG